MKKTTITTIAILFLTITGVKAQTLQDGINNLYAEKYNTAIGVFQKLLAANPNNIDATYWFGQTYMDMEEIAGVRFNAAMDLYQKGLQASANAPLLLVGLGHVYLRQGMTNEAKQNFETALTMTRTKKGDDPGIQTAIGRAIVDTKNGDFNYAIQILQSALTRDPKNTETLLQLGNAYRKADPGKGGSDAYQSYMKALEVNPNFSIANLRLAKLFETQKNWELVLKYLGDAVAKDPNFAAGYYELFYYYFYRSKFTDAEEQLKKYINSKLPETDIQDQYLYAMLCWAQKDFQCAVTKAESVVASLGNNTKPKVYRLLADSYFQKGDYVNAKKYSDLFFAKKNPEDFAANDYQIRANILSKTGGTADEIYSNYLQGSAMDTVLTSKIDFLKQGADALKSRGDSVSRIREGDLRTQIVKLKGNTSGQRDLFDAGFAYYQGKNYEKADSIFDIYTVKYPDEVFGPMMQYNIHRAIDSTMEKGMAVPWAEKYLTLLEKDTTKNKKTIIGVAGYLAQYYANITKDRTRALDYLRKMLGYDPNNMDIQNNIKLLEKAPATKPPATNQKGNTPGKSGNSKPAATTTPKPKSTKAVVKN